MFLVKFSCSIIATFLINLLLFYLALILIQKNVINILKLWNLVPVHVILQTKNKKRYVQLLTPRQHIDVMFSSFTASQSHESKRHNFNELFFVNRYDGNVNFTDGLAPV